MTTLDEISSTEASVDEDRSKVTLQEIFDQSSWRLYISTEQMQTNSLIKRFLNAHAQIPGGFSETLLGIVPIDTFRYTQYDVMYEGYLFLNGAVVKIRHESGTQMNALFVDESTAVKWGYPNNFLSYKDTHSESNGLQFNV